MYCFFFFNDTATTEIYTLSLHDALPISMPERLAQPKRLGDLDGVLGEQLASSLGPPGLGIEPREAGVRPVGGAHRGEGVPAQRLLHLTPRGLGRIASAQVGHGEPHRASDIRARLAAALGKRQARASVPLRLGELALHPAELGHGEVRYSLPGLDRKSTRLNSSHS